MKLLYITNGINGSGGLERVLSIKASYLADELGYLLMGWWIHGVLDLGEENFYMGISIEIIDG